MKALYFFGFPVRRLLRSLAVLPPVFKSALFARFCATLCRLSGLHGNITTNLGIARHLRVNYPEARHPTQVFGVPFHYKGERGGLFLVEALLPHSEAFVDIGANVGYYTYFAASVSKNRPILFFEPNPGLFEFVSQTVQKNGLEKVEGFPFAIGDADKESTFYLNNVDHACSTLNPTDAEKSTASPVTVSVRKFDSFLNEKQALRNLLVKVDVENAEFEFLEGAGESLKRISFLIIEILLPAIKNGFIRRVLAESKFQAYYINDFRLEHAPGGKFAYSEGEHNWLFCPDSPAELQQKLTGSRFQVVTN